MLEKSLPSKSDSLEHHEEQESFAIHSFREYIEKRDTHLAVYFKNCLLHIPMQSASNSLTLSWCFWTGL